VAMATVSIRLTTTIRVGRHVCAVARAHAHRTDLHNVRAIHGVRWHDLSVRERRHQQLEHQQQRSEVR